MALGTILGAAASAAASYGASKLFGQNKSGPAIDALGRPTNFVNQGQIDSAISGLDKNPFAGFEAGGLRAGLDSSGRVTVGATSERMGALGALRALFPQQAGEIEALRAKVAPGMSELRSSRLAELESSRSRAIGNLRDNLQRRRVLGSSFAADTLANTEAEFAQQKDKVTAESFMTELEMTNQLLGQEFDLRRGEFQAALDAMNMEADLAAQLSSQVTDIMAASARYKAQVVAGLATSGAQIDSNNAANRARLLAESDKGAGSFIGQITAPLSRAFGSEVKTFFS
jgi:hypothetical protein